MVDTTAGEPEACPPPLNVLSYERGRLRQALPMVVSRCMSHSAMTRFDASLVAAVYRFYGLEADVATAEAEVLEDEGERVRFFPWFLWDWRMEPGARTVGEAFVAESELAPHEQRLAEALCESYVAFYSVTSVERPRVFLEEIVTGARVEVDDDALAAESKPHHILLARLVRPADGDGAAFVDALYAELPPEVRPTVTLELEAILREAPNAPGRLLAQHTPELLDFAERVIDSLAQPPVALNGDGDEIVLCRSRARGAAADVVADAIHQADDIFRPVALRTWAVDGDAPGAPPLGWIFRERGRLWLCANSPARHDALVASLEARLDANFAGLSTYEDFGTAIQRWVEVGGGAPWLEVDPDVRAAAQAWCIAWARYWADTPLASLSDRTPREAVVSRQGREAVCTLLARLETLMLGKLGATPTLSLAHVKRELGLEPGVS